MPHFQRTAAITLFVTAAACAQRDFSNVEVKATAVAGRVHMLTGAGGNVGVSAGPDGVLIVDDQFAPLAEKIRAAIAGITGGSSEVTFVLNTHWHGDHTGGNPHFGRDAVIVAHTNVRNRLSTAQTLFGRTVEPLPTEGLPAVTFDEGLSIHFNGEEIKVGHFPNSHTDGDSIIHFTRSNVIHMGDTFFADRFPFVDLDHGGDIQGLIRTVEHVLTTMPPDAKLIPGHGPLSDRDDLKGYLEMLKATTAVVARGIATGTSLQDLQAAGLPDEWKRWANSETASADWIATVHKSLTREGG